MRQLQITLLFLILICMCTTACMGFNFHCKAAERKALLKFKHSFIYSSNRLSSWVGQDCCNWKGVGCDNVTNNIIKLDMGNDRYSPSNLEAEEVNPALLELKYLTYLDLSGVYFQESRFPEFFGSMRQLQHLNLSFTSFSGRVPRLLGNLTELVVLDLRDACGWNCEWERNSLEWAFKLENLKYLDLSGIDLSQAFDSLNLLHKLPSLSVLNLANCRLGDSHQLIRNSTISSIPLQHLDLQGNNFIGQIPHFLQNLSSITFLDLSFNNFIGPFPHFIQRLSFLTYLDLSFNQFSSSVPSWLANKRYLEHLDLTCNSFTHVDGGIMSIIGHLCTLKDLSLSYNQLQEEVSEAHVNFSRCRKYDLEYLSMQNNSISGYLPIIGSLSSSIVLDMSHNNSEPFPPFMGGLSSLYYIDLSYNKFSVVSPVIGNFPSLQTLLLSHNDLEILPPSLGGLPSLNHLDLSYNNLRVVPLVSENLSSLQTLDLSHNDLKTLPPSLHGLSSLKYLYLSYNHLRVVPSLTGSLSSLQFLGLSHNNLETLPPFLGQLSSLGFLNLSHNNLSVVHQVSLANLSSLTDLDISSNSLILDLSPDWMPPFQLGYLSILPCKLNNAFPNWVLTQENLFELDLSDTGIFGPLPNNIGNAMPSLQSIRLANNHINGSIPKSMCGLAGLDVLDLQKNWLSGEIPDCWANSPISVLDLSSNRLSGHIPNSLTQVYTLKLLSLNNNSLEGELPLQLSNSAELTILDVGRNNFHGEIPPWNGANFPLLQVLILRGNSFNGTIPRQLCSFHALQVVDLANNHLVGTIPECFGKFQGMGSTQQSSALIASPPSPNASNTTTYVAEAALVPPLNPHEWSAVEVIKGEEREYTTILHLLVNMDLSCNHLVGVIPAEISSLTHLVGLNLSHNHLKGAIPKEIGKIISLESLDLSFNNLSGSIPESISSLDSLSTMNLSFNKLHGQIPTSRHLQTLNDSSIYVGNLGLCGDPLPKKCFPDVIAHPPTSMVLEDEEDNKHEKMWFYLVIMLGFASGFWGVIGILVANNKWRYAYFGIAEDLAGWIYVRIAVKIARANRGPSICGV